MKAKEVIAVCKAKDIRFVDLKFCDIAGTWHHFALPASEFTDSLFEEGLSFDASSIKGWKSIESSDMLIKPDPSTAFVDPFPEYPTLSLICDVFAPLSKDPYSRSPRTIAKRAEDYLAASNIADKAFFGPEAEFFIFDDIRYGYDPHHAFVSLDSEEAAWASKGSSHATNSGYQIRFKEGYLPVPPHDKTNEIRNEMVMIMNDLGLKVERHHHEVATAGQAEIDIRYDSLLKMADNICLYKYIVKNVAYRNGKTATFMPKPIFGDNGSGLHVHISLWKNNKNLMAGDRYASLSQDALFFIGGLLKHAPALCAICNPTNNSYKRLVPGYEAPVALTYSAQNRSVVCRIPQSSSNPNSRRVEFRSPDPSANPYLAFASILMAGLDGIENQIDPQQPTDRNLYSLSPEESKKIQFLPESLKDSLLALQSDHQFLLKGNVFTSDFIQNFIEIKFKEYDAIRLRPHPYEYQLYYDI